MPPVSVEKLGVTDYGVGVARERPVGVRDGVGREDGVAGETWSVLPTMRQTQFLPPKNLSRKRFTHTGPVASLLVQVRSLPLRDFPVLVA